ncbi:MAG: ABC transporter substrate-binding protein [Chloroflexota bacterium]
MQNQSNPIKQKLTRRTFLALIVGSTVGAMAAGCAPAAAPPAATTAAPKATTAPAAPAPAATAAPAAATQAPASLKGVALNFLTWANFVPASDEVLKSLSDDWGKRSGATVKIEIISQNDLQAKSTAAVQAGAGPDLIMMRHNWPHLYEAGLVDVSDIAEDLGKQYGGYYPDQIANNKVKGTWRSVPFNGLPNAVVYRADVVKAVTGSEAFPDTYDDLLKVGTEIKKAKKMAFGQAHGHAINDANSCAYADLWAFGGKEVLEDGKTVALNSPETLASVDWKVKAWKPAFDDSGLGWDDSSNNRAYLAEEIWATNNGASIYLAARDDTTDNKDKMHQLASVSAHSANPKGPGGRFHYHVTNCMAVLNYSKNVPAAKEYIKYLMSKDVYHKWLVATKGFHTGPTKFWENDSVWDIDPKMKIFHDIGQYGRVPGYAAAPSKQASEAMSKFIIVDMFAKALSGSSSKDAIAWAESELKKIYSA